MKIDMHCHTSEGSSDGHVSIEEYINSLKNQGFDGMVVTDHDSYGGYNYYKKHLADKISDFVVLKGIEYDTFDAGHMIVIMPSDVHLPILEHRGLPVRILIHIVHAYGGIIGPAHPCGEPFLSIFSTGKFRRREVSIARRFDFIEGFNSCIDEEANKRACKIGRKFGKPLTGGSDTHNPDCVGSAFTILDECIKSEDELIRYIQKGGRTECGGTRYYGTLKDKLGGWNKFLVYGFLPYNKAGAAVHLKKRRNLLNEIKRDLKKKQQEALEAVNRITDRNAAMIEHIEDLLAHRDVNKMKEFIQHGSVNTFEHCERVASVSDKLGKKLRLKNIDRNAMLRAAMLHDFYLYDWHHKDDGSHGMHGYHHANIAVDNAAEKLGVGLKEQEIMSSHMWPLTITRIPKSKEAWVVCMADKYVSTKETLFNRRKRRG